MRWPNKPLVNTKFEIDELERFGGEKSSMRTISVTSFSDGDPYHMIVRFASDASVENPVHEYFAWDNFGSDYAAQAKNAKEIIVSANDGDSEVCIGVVYVVGDAAADEDGSESRKVKTFDEILTQKFSRTDEIATSIAFVMEIVEQSLKEIFDNLDRLVKWNDPDASSYLQLV